MAEVEFQAGELDGVEGGSGVGSHEEHADANAVCCQFLVTNLIIISFDVVHSFFCRKRRQDTFPC